MTFTLYCLIASYLVYHENNWFIKILLLCFSLAVIFIFVSNCYYDNIKKILIKKLKNKLDDEKIVRLVEKCFFQTHINIFTGIDLFIENVHSFSSTEFSDSEARIINDELDYAFDTYNTGEYNSLKTYAAMTYSLDRLIHLYLSSKISIQKCVSWIIVSGIAILPFLLFRYFPNKATFMILSFSYPVLFLFYNAIEKKGVIVWPLMLITWVLNFWSVVLAPTQMDNLDFIQPESVVSMLVSCICLCIFGIKTTNMVWISGGNTLKNKGHFISAGGLKYIISVKCAKRIRVPLLWFLFFSTVLGVLLMFFSIYCDNLFLDGPDKCIILTISVYFNGGINWDSYLPLEQFYISIELIMSYIINTLFLSNIVRLLISDT